MYVSSYSSPSPAAAGPARSGLAPLLPALPCLAARSWLATAAPMASADAALTSWLRRGILQPTQAGCEGLVTSKGQRHVTRYLSLWCGTDQLAGRLKTQTKKMSPGRTSTIALDPPTHLQRQLLRAIGVLQ